MHRTALGCTKWEEGVLRSRAAAIVGGEADEFLPIWGIWRRGL